MIRNFLQKSLRRYRFFLILFVIMVVAYGSWRIFFAEGLVIPQNFFESKRQSALVAQSIVDLSSETVNQLNSIQSLEKKRRYSEALDLTNKALARLSTMREKASELLAKLSDMTKALPDIKPADARSVAMRAINYEVSVINHLIAYNDALDQLLRLLTSQLLYGENIDARFEETVRRINDEAKTIDELTKKFNETIDSLDGK